MADGDRLRILSPEDMLGVAHARVREPLRPGHRPIAEHAVGGNIESDIEELDYRLPEGVELIDRPPPQLGAVIESQPTAVLEPSLVTGDRRPLDPLPRRPPQKPRL